MEKITITRVEAKFGKPNAQGVCTPFWACLLSDGRKTTIWDEDIAKIAMENEGKELMVEIKSTPAGYMNIRSINTEMPTTNPSHEAREGIERPITKQEAQESKPVPMSVKDELIIAQVILKGAVELAKTAIPPKILDNETLGEYLCMAVNELTGAYKLALNNLKAL